MRILTEEKFCSLLLLKSEFCFPVCFALRGFHLLDYATIETDAAQQRLLFPLRIVYTLHLTF